MNETPKVQLYLPPADSATGRMDLQINGETVAEFHDCQTRRHIESGAINLATSRLAEEMRATWEWWRMNHSEYHYKQPGEVDLGEIN